MARETFVRPLGLITLPNELGQYPAGAMSQAQNLVMRRPGAIQQIPAGQTWLANYAAAGRRVHKLFSTAQQLLSFYFGGGNQNIDWLTGAGANAATLADTVYALDLDQAGRICPFLFRSRTLINTQKGVLVADYTNPSNATQRTLRWSGLPQPLICNYSFTAVAGGPVTHETAVGYSVVLRRKYADGYELVSAPSPIQRFLNPHATDDYQVTVDVQWGPSGGSYVGTSGVKVGDILELYRTPAAAWDPVSPDYDIQTGTSCYLVASIAVTSAVFMSITDATAPDGLGTALYTNPGFAGQQAAKRPAPVAKCTAVFKGYTFYGNITQPPQFKATWPAGNGNLSIAGPNAAPANAAAHGVGYRSISGTFTAGSNNVTGVAATATAGMRVGQFITGATATDPARIASVGATSFTMDQNANVTGALNKPVWDCLELNGVEHFMGDVLTLLNNMAFSTTQFFWTGAAIPLTVVQLAGGSIVGRANQQELIIEPYRFPVGGGALTVRATHGEDYDPPIPTLQQTAQSFATAVIPNLLKWSDEQQPEHCQAGQELFIGGGEIYGLASTTDTLWIFASDGLWRLTGVGHTVDLPAAWSVENVDSTLILSGPQAFTVLRDSVYAYTNRGLVRIAGSGVQEEISSEKIGDLMPGPYWSSTLDIFMERDETTDEIFLVVSRPSSISKIYVYATRYDAFTTYEDSPNATAMVYAPDLASVMLGQSPVSGNTCGVVRQDSTYTGGHQQAVGDFQSLYGDDPMVLKQWIDMIIVGARESLGLYVQARFNGVNVGSSVPLLFTGSDYRRNFGVPRATPAMAHMLRPGFVAAPTGSQPVRINGISLRFEPLTDQASARGAP